MSQSAFNFPTNGNGDKIEYRRKEVQQAVANACDQMRTEGVHPRDYVEQLSWLFFLKAFEETENRLEQEAAFEDEPYERRLDGDYRWSAWTAMITRPDEMLRFVDAELFPKLQNLGSDAVGERFRRIFSQVSNRQKRPAHFAQVVAQVDRLHFNDRTDVIVLSQLYEELLKDVAQTAGYAGEFYTPRHLIRAMVQVVDPRLGDRVYDPCFGSAGFLAESADHVRVKTPHMSGEDLEAFHRNTFFGRELVPLAYLTGTMNLMLHGVQEARLELANTLEEHDDNVPERYKYSVILANPPYGGKLAERPANFLYPSKSTESLFLQHIMRNLAPGGRAAVVVPEGVLFRGGPDERVRRDLLQRFRLHTVLSLPAGVFLPYTGVKTNVLFFDRAEDGSGTDRVWYYELTNDGYELKQTRKPQEGDQLPDFLEKQPTRAESERSWTVSIEEIEERGWDLSARNPNRADDYEHRPALDLVQSIRAKEERIFELLGELEELLEEGE